MKKILFWGTPQLTWTLLDALKEAGLTPTIIGSVPDKPQGRKLVLTPPEIKEWATKNNIQFIQPEKLDDLTYQELSKTPWDLFVVVAYGKIIPERFISLPTHGTINVHYSLLPRWRGATPVESAILHGDEKTGVCVQQMRYKLDTGPILNELTVDIPKDCTAPKLRELLNNLAGPLLVKTITEIFDNKTRPKEQDEASATYCTKIEKEDGLIDLNDSGENIWRKFRAFYGWPGIYYFEKHQNKNLRVKITDATWENNTFKIVSVVPEGKKEMLYEDFLRGLRD